MEIPLSLSAALGKHPSVGWHPVSKLSKRACCRQHTESLYSLCATVNGYWGGQRGEMQEGLSHEVYT